MRFITTSFLFNILSLIKRTARCVISKNTTLYVRFVSGLVLCVFLVQQTAMAAPSPDIFKSPELKNPPIEIKIPKNVALIEDSFRSSPLSPRTSAGPHKTLILIQDAHTNASGQANIAEALDAVLRQQKIRYVFTEGGQGNLSLSGYRRTASLIRREAVGRAYLNKGYLQGAEYLDLTSRHDFVLWGVEDDGLYDKGLQIYRSMAKERQVFLPYLKRMIETTRILKSKIYNPGLNIFDNMREAFLKNQLPVVEYVDFLMGEAHKWSLEHRDLSALKSFGSMRLMESEIDFEQAGADQNEAFEFLSKNDPNQVWTRPLEDHKALHRAVLSDEGSRINFYKEMRTSLLNHMPHREIAKQYPELWKYFEYLADLDQFLAGRFMDEMKALELRIQTFLTQSPDEMNLVRISECLRYLEKLVELRLSSEEYEWLTRTNPKPDIRRIAGFLNQKIMEMGRYHEHVVFEEEGFENLIERGYVFYELTYQRDRVFVDQALHKMIQSGEETAVLVTGGYHSTNLKKLLKDRNVSYISITPRILHETNIERYEKLLLAQPLNHGQTQITSAPRNTAAWMLRPLMTYRGPVDPARLEADLTEPAFEGAADLRGHPDRRNRPSWKTVRFNLARLWAGLVTGWRGVSGTRTADVMSYDRFQDVYTLFENHRTNSEEPYSRIELMALTDFIRRWIVEDETQERFWNIKYEILSQDPDQSELHRLAADIRDRIADYFNGKEEILSFKHGGLTIRGMLTSGHIDVQLLWYLAKQIPTFRFFISDFNKRVIPMPDNLTRISLRTEAIMSGETVLDTDRPNRVLFDSNDRGVGPVYPVSEGELVLAELNKGEKTVLVSFEHFNCTCMSIRAKKGNKDVIGHAHLFPMQSGRHKDRDAYWQYVNVLNYLADEKNGLENIELILSFERRLDGFRGDFEGLPRFDVYHRDERIGLLEKLARDKGIKIRSSIFRGTEAGSGNVLLTPHDYIFFTHQAPGAFRRVTHKRWDEPIPSGFSDFYPILDGHEQDYSENGYRYVTVDYDRPLSHHRHKLSLVVHYEEDESSHEWKDIAGEAVEFHEPNAAGSSSVRYRFRIPQGKKHYTLRAYVGDGSPVWFGKNITLTGTRAAMTGQSKNIQDALELHPRWTLQQLADALETTADDPKFREDVETYIRAVPKTVLHEHVSGLIYAEHMLEYFMDDADRTRSDLLKEETARRLEGHREARRRFVLTVASKRSARELQVHPVDPSLIPQEEADRQFRNILGIEPGTPFSTGQIPFKTAVEKLKQYTTYRDKNYDVEKFEMPFAVIKSVTDAHPDFRFDLVKKGIRKQFEEDSLRNIEVTDFHGDSLQILISNLVDIEADAGYQLNASVLKGFRKDHLYRVMQSVKTDAARRGLMHEYDGQDLAAVRDRILKEVTDSDFFLYGVPKHVVKKEFDEAFSEIEIQVKRDKKGRATDEDVREKLILVYAARKLAQEDMDQFEIELQRLSIERPLYRKRVGGISSIGDEWDYINWIGSPIHRKAKRMGLWRSSHMGESWRDGQYLAALRRIRREIDLGVERLAHLTVLGLDFNNHESIPDLNADDRREALRLQAEIFKMLRLKSIHVEVNPTSQITISPAYSDYPSHAAMRFFEEGISFSINPDDSSVFDTGPSQEIVHVWFANPQLPFNRLISTVDNARSHRFYEAPAEVKERLAGERQRVLTAQDRYAVPSVAVYGSARIPPFNPQARVGLELGYMVYRRGLSIKTGGGPGSMRDPFEGWLRRFTQELEKPENRWLKLLFKRDPHQIPAELHVQAIRILLNPFEPTNEFVDKEYLFDFLHFVYRKLALHLKSLGTIAMVGGFGTFDEILESWRRERPTVLLNSKFYMPLMDVLKDRFEFAGIDDRIRSWPHVTDSIPDALDHMLLYSQSSYVELTNPFRTEAAIREMHKGIDMLSQLPMGVAIVGHPANPSTHPYGKHVCDILGEVTQGLIAQNVPPRVASRDVVFDTVLEAARQDGQVNPLLQTVLYRWHRNQDWTANEKHLRDTGPYNLQTQFVYDDSTHQLVLSYDARGYIFLPGGVGTLNKLFDVVVSMQTGTVRQKPIVLVGKEFWAPILTKLKTKMEGFDPPLITPGDIELMRVADSSKEVLRILGLNNHPGPSHTGTQLSRAGAGARTSSVQAIESVTKANEVIQDELRTTQQRPDWALSNHLLPVKLNLTYFLSRVAQLKRAQAFAKPLPLIMDGRLVSFRQTLLDEGRVRVDIGGTSESFIYDRGLIRKRAAEARGERAVRVAPELLMFQSRLENSQRDLLLPAEQVKYPKFYIFDLNILGQPNLLNPQEYEIFAAYVRLMAFTWLAEGAYFKFVGGTKEMRDAAVRLTGDHSVFKKERPDLVEIWITNGRLEKGKVNILMRELRDFTEVHAMKPLLDLFRYTADLDIRDLAQVRRMTQVWSLYAGFPVSDTLIRKMLLGLEDLSQEERALIALKPMTETETLEQVLWFLRMTQKMVLQSV